MKTYMYSMIVKKAGTSVKKPFLTYPYPYVYNKMMYNTSDRMDTVSNRMKTWMKANGMNANSFTVYLNNWGKRHNFSTCVATIRAYLAGKCSPKIDRLVLISRAMGVSPQWLAGYGPCGIEINARVDYTCNNNATDGNLNDK